MTRLLGERREPFCPMCDGPCRCPFPRSPFVFPDRLRRVRLEDAARDPDPEPAVKPPSPRGRRKRLARDRMIHGPERTTAIHGPGEDR